MVNMQRDESVELKVDAWIKSTYEDTRRDYKDGEYHVSDFTGFGKRRNDWCPRKAYLKYGLGEEKYSREKAGVFERGRQYELKMGELILPKVGWTIVEKQIPEMDNTRVEYKVSGDINIVGHYDFIASVDSSPFVVETKSTNFNSRDVFERFCKEPDFPKGEHILQVNFYAWLKKLPWRLVYISIGDLSCRAWKGEADDKLAQIVIDRVKETHEHRVKKEVPDGVVNWMCSFEQRQKPRAYCDYYNECRLLGSYGIHPAIYGVCMRHKPPLEIPESTEDGHGNMMVDEGGRLLCPECGQRVIRRTMTSAQAAKFEGSEGPQDYTPVNTRGKGYFEREQPPEQDKQ